MALRSSRRSRPRGARARPKVEPRRRPASSADADGVRGRIHDHVYREYLPAGDAKLAARVGKRMAYAIWRVRGREYKVKQAVGLYPTAGASDDYAYSRHLLDRQKGKIIAFTVEWGRSRSSTPFHPPYDEMRKVMREVTAGLLELCLNVGRWT